MQLFNSELLAPYSTANALIFADEYLLIHRITSSSQVAWQEIGDLITTAIQAAYYSAPLIIVKCDKQIVESLLPANYQFETIRNVLINSQTLEQHTILKAYHWLNWDKASQYCGQCGHLLSTKLHLPEKECERCQQVFFPKFSPAIMILVQRDNEILLGRSKHFRPGVYSALAGFIEMGETAEMAVHREVKEEVGITITDVRYFATQAWPFPDSFMIAYKAVYLNGEINIDKQELEDAKWFNLNALPPLPPRLSIARLLIDSIPPSNMRRSR